MAQSIITQVDRNGKPQVRLDDDESGYKPRRKKSFWAKLCCCVKESDDSAPTGQGNYTGRDIHLTEQPQAALLPPSNTPHLKTLVLDLDETLVHSSFKPIPEPHFIVPVEIEDQIHKVYVLKRPYVDEFLEALGPQFEIVVFTASLAKYADPVLDLLDKHKVVRWRLFREACSNYKGNYVKDLSIIGRDIRHTIIIDNSPSSYLFHPENAVPCESWFDDENDTELLDMIPLLESLIPVDNVRSALEQRRQPNGGFNLRAIKEERERQAAQGNRQ